jgi:hypothetical protein
MKQLNTEENHRVIRNLDEVPYFIQWIEDSREENRVELEQISDPVEIARLQGENRAINKMLDKVPKTG